MLDERTSRRLLLVFAIAAALVLLFQCDLVGTSLLLMLMVPGIMFLAAVMPDWSHVHLVAGEA
jgi:cell division protein FtsW (lipid II flippase)